MTHANRIIDDINNARPYLELIATPAIPHSRRNAVGDNNCPLSTADCAVNDPVLKARVVRQVREDQDDRRFDVPDLLSEKDYDIDMQVCAAAREHANYLSKAERKLDQALNLVGLMLAAIGDLSDARAMQTETGLNAIEKKLGAARTWLDKHDTRHLNLFLAYFDLRGKTDE